MLRVDGLEVGYGPLTVLRDVSLRVDRGEVVALIGANGAGKTTLLKGISGLLPPARGRVQLDDEDITRQSPHAIVRRGVAQVPEGRQVFAEMTVRDPPTARAVALVSTGDAVDDSGRGEIRRGH